MTYFQTPPWKLTFRNYYTTVWLTDEYYFTIVMPEQAGAGLGRLKSSRPAGSRLDVSFAVTRVGFPRDSAVNSVPCGEGPPPPPQPLFLTPPKKKRREVQHPFP